MSATTPAPIFTLTGNLLAERTLEFADWSVGGTQRAQRESFQVGGKGINVSKMLERLGAPTTALCFAGGSTGADSAFWLTRQKFCCHVFPTANATRIGIVVRGGSQPETTFFSPDVPPDPAAIRACADYLDAQPRGQVLALCGSVPGWAAPDFDPVRAALIRWLEGGHLAADSYGPPLAWLAAQPLALIKINATELRTLFPAESAQATTPELIRLAAQRWPVQRWIVTDGPGPVWFSSGSEKPVSLAPPRVQEVSATGSGDVLFALVLERVFLRGLSLPDAIAQALPYAAANAGHAGVADFPLP
ncbi:MAG: PfkB family carbohydrate kinase [Opitutaceae bacterium]